MIKKIRKQDKQAKKPVHYHGAVGHIVLDTELCSGCRSCMAICSLSHFGVSYPEVSGIQVMGFLREGNLIQGVTCRQCKVPKCLIACPQGAIYIDGKTGARVIDSEKCNGCQDCIEACPVKASSVVSYYSDVLRPIRYNAEAKVCFKCDLCGGNPLCVKHCPMNALRLANKEV